MCRKEDKKTAQALFSAAGRAVTEIDNVCKAVGLEDYIPFAFIQSERGNEEPIIDYRLRGSTSSFIGCHVISHLKALNLEGLAGAYRATINGRKVYFGVLPEQNADANIFVADHGERVRRAFNDGLTIDGCLELRVD